MIAGAKKLFSGVNLPLLPQFQEIYGRLVDDLGCRADVKTIYVAFNLTKGPVSSVHPHSGTEMEIALALPESATSDLVYMAPHLKWRTLPVAVRLEVGEPTEDVLPLLDEACKRVREGHHDVKQPDEKFIAHRRRPGTKR